MKIQNHDEFPKLDHRTAPSFWAERDWVVDSPPVPRAPWGRAARSTGEFSNGTSGENYSGIHTRLVLGQHTGGGRVAVERTGLVLRNPNADQVAADVMPFGDPVKRLAGQVVLDDLPLELDRVAAVLGHGLSPRKPGRDSLIRVTSPCPPGGVHSR